MALSLILLSYIRSVSSSTASILLNHLCEGQLTRLWQHDRVGKQWCQDCEIPELSCQIAHLISQDETHESTVQWACAWKAVVLRDFYNSYVSRILWIEDSDKSDSSWYRCQQLCGCVMTKLSHTHSPDLCTKRTKTGMEHSNLQDTLWEEIKCKGWWHSWICSAQLAPLLFILLTHHIFLPTFVLS